MEYTKCLALQWQKEQLGGGWAASLRVGVVASLRVEKWTVIHLEKEKQLGKPCRWTQKKRRPSLWKKMVIGVKNVARRRKKRRATKFIGMGNAYISERATKFKTTGNEIYRNGQRNFYTSPFVSLAEKRGMYIKKKAVRESPAAFLLWTPFDSRELSWFYFYNILLINPACSLSRATWPCRPMRGSSYLLSNVRNLLT